MRSNRFALVAACSLVSLLTVIGTASADIYTFWKTTTCPTVAGKTLQSAAPGVMEAVVVGNPPTAVGGAFCDLDTSPKSARMAGGSKGGLIFKDNVQVRGAEEGPKSVGLVVGNAWDCVVCWYDDTSAGVPTISALGTALLMGGLITAAFYQLRRRQL